MKAFFVAELTVKNPELFQEYAAAAGASMKPFGGEVLVKGGKFRQLAGNTTYNSVAIVSFPSQEKLNNWYDSSEYQDLIPLRDQAADMTLTAFQLPK